MNKYNTSVNVINTKFGNNNEWVLNLIDTIINFFQKINKNTNRTEIGPSKE